MHAKPIAILEIALVLSVSAAGQGQSPSQLDRQLLGLERLADESDGYKLGGGDLIEIQVFGVEELSRSARVSASGHVTLPFVGPQMAAGLTPGEFGEFLHRLLKEKGFVKDAQVTVLVKEYRSKPVQVLGAVNQSGSYFMDRPLRLTDALALAGGIDPELAGEEAVITRERPEPQGAAKIQEVIRVDLNRLLQEGDASQNLPIQSGDVVHVPERVMRLFYIIGDVHKPGAFELPQKRELRISQALAQAGGTLKTAKGKKGILVRFDDQGQRQEIQVNLNRILRGRAPDLAVLPDDVIFVPGSTAKSIGYGLLGAVPRTLSDVIRR